jgi:Protein of unknown function (DUF3037)
MRPGEGWIPYDFAVIRVVPHPHLDVARPIGVVLHAPTAEFLDMRIVTEPGELAARAPDTDVELLARYVRALRAICAGEPEAGPIARTSRSERFHWLTAPRSDVIESGPIHSGLCDDPGRTLDALFNAYVDYATR